MKLRDWILLAAFAAGLFVLNAADAEVPSVLRYQGQLLDDRGAPISGPVRMHFALFDMPTEGELLWEEQQEVDVQGGVFEVMLGMEDPIKPSSLPTTGAWLAIRVEDGEELVPRSPIVSVGYSLRVGTVNGAAGGTISGALVISQNLTVDGGATVAGDLTTNGALSLPDGITMSVAGEVLTIDAGTSQITMDVYGALTISSHDVSIVATNSLTMDANGDLAITAGGDINIDAGAEANIVAGSTAKVEGSAGSEVSSSAITVVKGSLVQIN